MLPAHGQSDFAANMLRSRWSSSPSVRCTRPTSAHPKPSPGLAPGLAPALALSLSLSLPLAKPSAYPETYPRTHPSCTLKPTPSLAPDLPRFTSTLA